MRLPVLSFFLLACLCSGAQRGASVSFEQWISLKGAGGPVLSPDGKTVVYSINSTDWSANTYDSELWMARAGEEPLQLTRTSKGGSGSARFTPDGRFISFLADRGDKTQLYIISVRGGEALQVTKDEDGVGAYEWSPDGRRIAYTKSEAESKREKAVKERYGAFAEEGTEFRHQHLWLLNFHYDSVVLAGQVPCYPVRKDSTGADSVKPQPKQDCVKLPVARALTYGAFSVTGFGWHPDGKRLLFNRVPNTLILSSMRADIVEVDADSKAMKTLVANPVGDFIGRIHPEGKAFVYSSSVDDSLSNFYRNNRLFVYDYATGKSTEIATDLDENKNAIGWSRQGLFLTALNKTSQKVYSVDLKTGKTKALSLPLPLVGSVSFSPQSDLVAVSGTRYDGLNEIYTGPLNGPWKQLTNQTVQIRGWNTPVNEVISWKSKDGATIEGILLKPKNFSANKKYPLLVVIHGGPTGIDMPDPVPSYVYPMMHWVEKGALVLRVNYRGSAGYGEQFRSLNVRNLGVGDMWDVVSGVEYLSGQGFVDTARMGCMGWSQGGYISAFLTTNSHLFKAISVGAGISNWMTYYVNTDITPFTRQYLKATPWEDEEIYRKTSPMTNINNARTPTLIQHGEFDKRVPIPNAYELYRGLQDRNVPSKLIVYKGFGHGINKPKERLAAVWHNWQWINKYVFGEEEEIPVE
ncbi:MAG TPA: S9 family peptidase [Chitinophagaceae bacterium]|nr:S9 family peptidase [Chitinophagaceae bacterium]